MKLAMAFDVLVLVLVAAIALFSEPITVAQAKQPPTPATCTLTGTYFIDTTVTPDDLEPAVFGSGDCGPLSCSYTFSSRIGDVGDFFAVCQGSTACDAYTTITVDATVTSFPLTDEPEVIAFCSTNPGADAACFTGSFTKGCPTKEVDCFTDVGVSCNSTKKLGGGIKGTFVCILNLPEPGLPSPGKATVTVTANCQLS